jgi:probable biosynthetic protein (TIGR04098 family)
MPQMLFHGLSERWLLKESGDAHWRLICSDLGVPSGQLLSEDNDRLYASFTRIRYEATGNLQQMRENEPLELRGTLSRFGDKRYFSSLLWSSPTVEIRFQMSSVFIKRESDNKALSRLRPCGVHLSTCPLHSVMPVFAQEYQLWKAAVTQGQQSPEAKRPLLLSHTLSPEENATFETNYEINPYHDLNGVNLLYFASYGRIHDLGERDFVRRLTLPNPAESDWALAAAPLARDIFFFANADIGDVLTFRVHSAENFGTARIGLHTSLTRQVDGCRIADLFTLKEVAASSGYASLFL